MTARKLLLVSSLVGALAVAFLAGRLGTPAASVVSPAPVASGLVPASTPALADPVAAHLPDMKQDASSTAMIPVQPTDKHQAAFRIETNMIVPAHQVWSKFSPQSIVVADEPDYPVDFDLVSTRIESGRTINNYRNPVDGAFLVSAASDDLWFGILSIPGADSYEITMTSAGMQKVIKNGTNDVCGAQALTKEATSTEAISPEPVAGIAADGALVTVDIGYYATAGTIAAQGGFEGLKTKLIAYTEAGNAILLNSDIAMMWHFSHLTQVDDYIRDGKLSTDLNTFTSGSLSSFVKATQNEKGNDINVLMASGDSDWAGLAWMPGHECVVVASASYHTVAHEIGHNFGCAHDRTTEGASANATAYNYGVMFDDEQNFNFSTGTVMSYAGVRLEYFSNPTKSYHGHALGVAEGGMNPADNSRTIREGMSRMATYKSAPSAPVITTQPVSATITAGNTISLSVTATGGNLTYQWQHNGVDIAGATSSAYSKYTSTVADSGAYAVKVTNNLGSVTSANATITVNAPPVVTPPKKSGGGGGGAVSPFALLAIGVAAAIHKVRRKK